MHGKLPDEDASTRARVPLLSIFLYTTLMALASGFGALPFLFFGRLKPYWAGIANAVAVGVMMAASFDLLHEGAPHSPALTILGMIIGALFIKASQDYLSKFEDASFEDLQGADARKAMLIIAVMAAHAFGEGSGVGVSFSGDRGWAQGLLVTIAIGLHNIPEGMAVAGVMMSKGSTPTRALYWTLVCALPQALVAVPSYLFVESFSTLLPVALGFAAGCMIWISFAELLPDALESADHGHVATAASLSAAWLQGLSMLVASLEKPGGALASPFVADPKELALKMMSLLPKLIAPCLAAAAASLILPMLTRSKGRDEWMKIQSSLSLSIGLASATIGWMGFESILYQILNGGSHIVGTLLSAFSGIGMAALLWASVTGPSKPSLENNGDAENPRQPSAELNGEGMGKEWLDQVKRQYQPDPSSPPQRPSGSGRVEGVPVSNRQLQPPHIDVNGKLVPCPPNVNHGLFLNRHHLSPSRKNDLSIMHREHIDEVMRRAGGSAMLACVVMTSGGLASGLKLAQAALGVDCAILNLTPALMTSLTLGISCGALGKVLKLSSQMMRRAAGNDVIEKDHSKPRFALSLSSFISDNSGLLLASFISLTAVFTSGSCLAGLPLTRLSNVKYEIEIAEQWIGPLDSAVGGACIFVAVVHLWPLTIVLSEGSGSNESLGSMKGGRLTAGRGLLLGLVISVCCSLVIKLTQK